MIVPIAVTSLGLAGVEYVAPLLARLYYTEMLRRKVCKTRILVLTYDDGPSREVTPKLLDLLQRQQAAATFFMLGRSAEKYPDIADQVIEAGHDVGCHSHQHLHAWKVPPWKAIADVHAGYKTLSRWILPNGMYRPPYGKMTFSTFWAVHRRGAPVFWWTVDTGDTRSPLPSPSHAAEMLLEQGGGIFLMHDSGHSRERNEFVLETTAALLEVARRHSIQIKRLHELCV